MSMTVEMGRAATQVSRERIRHRICVPRGVDSPHTPSPAQAASLARPRGTRPPAPVAAAQSQPQTVADTRSLDRIGWAFSIATLIVWAITAALVRGAVP